MVANAICNYLAGAGLDLTVGRNLFAVRFPIDAPDQAVAVDVYSGRPSDRVLGGAVANEYPVFHVFVRDGRDHAEAAAVKAQAIYDALENLGPIMLGGVEYRDIHSLDGPPRFLDCDGTQRPIYVLNFQAMKDKS